MTDELVRAFQGPDLENQRLRVTVEHWSDFCGDFVHVFHSHGDDSVTDMVFTYEEGKYLLGVLETIYTGRAS